MKRAGPSDNGHRYSSSHSIRPQSGDYIGIARNSGAAQCPVSVTSRTVPPLVHADPPSIVTASPMFYSRHRCRAEQRAGFPAPGFSLEAANCEAGILVALVVLER